MSPSQGSLVLDHRSVLHRNPNRTMAPEQNNAVIAIPDSVLTPGDI